MTTVKKRPSLRKVPNVATLQRGKYKESDLVRKGKDIYLKEGVKPSWKEKMSGPSPKKQKRGTVKPPMAKIPEKGMKPGMPIRKPSGPIARIPEKTQPKFKVLPNRTSMVPEKKASIMPVRQTGNLPTRVDLQGARAQEAAATNNYLKKPRKFKVLGRS